MWFTFPISVVTQPSQRSHTVVVATKNTMATLLLLNCVSCPHHQKVDLRIGFFRNRLEVQFAGAVTLQKLADLTRRIASKAAPHRSAGLKKLGDIREFRIWNFFKS